MIILRWREDPRLKLRWRLPNTAATPVAATGVSTMVATIVGPEGKQGVQGPPGQMVTESAILGI